MRKESIVVAARAGGCTGDMPDARLPRLCGNEPSQVHRPRLPRFFTGELPIHVRSNLIAGTADRRTQMDAKLHRGKAALSERFDPSLHDPSRRTSPAGVEQ